MKRGVHTPFFDFDRRFSFQRFDRGSVCMGPAKVLPRAWLGEELTANSWNYHRYADWRIHWVSSAKSNELSVKVGAGLCYGLATAMLVSYLSLLIILNIRGS